MLQLQETGERDQNYSVKNTIFHSSMVYILLVNLKKNRNWCSHHFRWTIPGEGQNIPTTGLLFPACIRPWSSKHKMDASLSMYTIHRVIQNKSLKKMLITDQLWNAAQYIHFVFFIWWQSRKMQI